MMRVLSKDIDRQILSIRSKFWIYPFVWLILKDFTSHRFNCIAIGMSRPAAPGVGPRMSQSLSRAKVRAMDTCYWPG